MNDSRAVAIVLAAGKGTRMKADLAKVLFPMAGRPLVDHVLDTVAAAGIDRTIVVVGHQAERVREALAGRSVSFAVQAEQLGTGHAVLMAAPQLAGETGEAVVLAGDVPLIRPATLTALLDHQRESGAAMTVLTAVLPDAAGYGRIVRDAGDGSVLAIVEHKDCTGEQRAIREINSSIYAFNIPFLLGCLPRLGRSNRQGEYYLTDTVAMAREQGLGVEAVVGDFEELSGINTRDQLTAAEAVLRRRA